jgi:cytoskeleton protein RodZ
MSGGPETDSNTSDPSGSHGAIGARLKTARQARQLTTEAVAQQLKLDVSVIDALEKDDKQHLPAPIFVQGYLRSYARLLGLPEEELAGDYTRQSGELPPLTVGRKSAGQPVLRLPSGTGKWIRNTILVVLALALLWLAYPYASRMLDAQNQPGDEPSPGHLDIPPAVR